MHKPVGSDSLVAAIFLLFLLIGFNPNLISALPAGFVDEGVLTRDSLMTGAFAPNPRNGGKPMLLLSTKSGKIYAMEDPDNSEENILVGDFDSLICTNGERGLQSIHIHPNFTENRYIYLYYSSFVEDCPEDDVTGPPNHCSRFVMDPDTLWIDPATEKIILQTSPAPKKVHNGGSLQFGLDGYLYITTGDVGQRDPSYSQNLANLYGSILRVDENGIAPRDNPFTTASGGTGVACGQSGGVPPAGSPSDAVCEEIYAYGLRNPFRLSMDVNSKDRVLFTVGDVGASHWEEVSFGGADYMGTNYGWPIHEGPCLIGKSDDCPLADDGFTEPHYYYQHVNITDGGCVVGSVHVPQGLWPEKYQFLFIDFVFGKIYNIIDDPDAECRTCEPPTPRYSNETFYERELMIDMFFGPYKNTQALYVVARDSGQSIRRIRFTGSNNSAPVASFTVSDSMVDIGEVVVFNGNSSSDLDDDALTYFWEFGDGSTSTQVAPAHIYNEFGQFTVKLTVTDTLGQTNQVFDTVVCGTGPSATVVSPSETDRFRVGQRIRVYGNGTDASGMPLNDTQFAWEVEQHHGDHYHPFLDKFEGNDFLLDPAPAPEDFTAATNSFLRIIMYATDSSGIVTTVTQDVYPKKVFIELLSVPSGLEVLVDEFPINTPVNITSWENHKLKLNVLDQGGYVFQSWSIGGARKTNYTVPARNLTNPVITVTFAGSGPVQASTPVPVAPSEKPVVAPVATSSKPVATTSTPLMAPQVEEPVTPQLTAPTSLDFSTSGNSEASIASWGISIFVAAILCVVSN